jgi:hypothetical protein
MRAVIAFIAFVVIAVAIAGGSDYEEAKRSQAEYCEMVAKGYWPDYEGQYKAWCR